MQSVGTRRGRRQQVLLLNHVTDFLNTCVEQNWCRLCCCCCCVYCFVTVAGRLWAPVSSLCHCLSFTITPPTTSFSSVCELTSHFVYSTFLLVICENTPPWMLKSCFSPHAHSLHSSLISAPPPPCESHGRNGAGCQLDERGRTGPADLVMLSHQKAPLGLWPPSPSFTGACESGFG